jgi:hypothetical protein
MGELHSTFQAKVLVPGEATGKSLILAEPLSLWGGLDPKTGDIIDQRHPSCGENVAGRVLVLPVGRGSSSASSILLESVRMGMAPAAIITAETDAILALGAAVAQEIYGKSLPVIVLSPDAYRQLQNGQLVTITMDGLVAV